jgi:hypothetical protein
MCEEQEENGHVHLAPSVVDTPIARACKSLLPEPQKTLVAFFSEASGSAADTGSIEDQGWSEEKESGPPNEHNEHDQVIIVD